MKSVWVLIIAYCVVAFGLIVFVLYCSGCAPASTGKWIPAWEPCPKGYACDTLPGTHVKPVADTVKPVEW